MLYIIDKKCYINVAPNVYKEVIFEEKNGETNLVVTPNRVECYNMEKVSAIDVESAKKEFMSNKNKYTSHEDNISSSRRTTRTGINRSKNY